MNRKVLVYVALAVGALSIGAYGANYWWIGTPQYSLNQLRTAVQNHNVDTAFKYMDYDKMFEGFWGDISANAIATIKKSGDGSEAFGAILGMNMLEGMKPGVKTTIRRAMEEVIRKESPEEENSATSSKPTLTNNIEKGTYKLTKSDDKAYIEFESGMRFTLSRHPNRYWQIIRIEGIDFPTDELDKPTTKEQAQATKSQTTQQTSQPSSVPVRGFVSPINTRLDVKTQVLKDVYLTISKPEDFISDTPGTYTQPKVGSKYVSVYVSFDNESQNSLDYNPYNFSVVDPSGGNYDIGFILVDKSPKLDSGTLNSSNRVSGYLLFEVPVTVPTTQFSVHYESGGYPSATVDFK